jgi:alpha/beta hydrolase family protein
MLYVHHPSDLVGNATMEAFWRRPKWIDHLQGYDVPTRAGWYPIVTGLQEVADLIAGFSAPSGYGHNYSIDFVVGWAGPRTAGPPPTAAGSSGTSRPSRPRWPIGTRDGSVGAWQSRSGTCSLSPRVNSLVGSRR